VPDVEPAELVPVELVGVRVELPTNTPVVILREIEGRRRTVSIFIGGPEATAIAFALEGVETPRPLTHDLMVEVIASLGSSIVRVVVTELRDTTFYAELHLDDGDDENESGLIVVSARPSDAVALAARVDCPIFVSRALVDEVGFLDTSSDTELDDDPEEVVEEFRAFIDNVSPEDFAS